MHHTKGQKRLALGLMAGALLAAFIPATAAASPGPTIAPAVTVAPIITISPAVTASSAPSVTISAPVIANIAITVPVNFIAFNRNSTISTVTVVQVCQQAAGSCNHG
jgi:hypothetical protein